MDYFIQLLIMTLNCQLKSFPNERLLFEFQVKNWLNPIPKVKGKQKTFFIIINFISFELNYWLNQMKNSKTMRKNERKLRNRSKTFTRKHRSEQRRVTVAVVVVVVVVVSRKQINLWLVILLKWQLNVAVAEWYDWNWRQLLWEQIKKITNYNDIL